MQLEIFVFGSNLAGRHGRGAALHAVLYKGATYGQGEGLQGNSYAIPTKDSYLQPLPLEQVQEGVERFLRFAAQHPKLSFEVTDVGCGLAGFRPEQIAPMFASAPGNCRLSQRFRTLINQSGPTAGAGR